MHIIVNGCDFSTDISDEYML